MINIGKRSKAFRKKHPNKNIKALHEAILIEWDNGEEEVIWGGCMSKLAKMALKMEKKK